MKTLSKAGVDPANSAKPITYPLLCDLCLSRFGIAYSTGGMIQLLRREAMLLRPFVAKARRALRLKEAAQVVRPRRGSGLRTPASRRERREHAS